MKPDERGYMKLTDRIDIVGAVLGIAGQAFYLWHTYEQARTERIKRELDKLELAAKRAPAEPAKRQWYEVK